MNLKDVTIAKVLAAYKRRGWIPVKGGLGNSKKKKGCALEVLGVDLDMDDSKISAFIHGFDEVNVGCRVNLCLEHPGYYKRGQQVVRAVFEAYRKGLLTKRIKK